MATKEQKISRELEGDLGSAITAAYHDFREGCLDRVKKLASHVKANQVEGVGFFGDARKHEAAEKNLTVLQDVDASFRGCAAKLTQQAVKQQSKGMRPGNSSSGNNDNSDFSPDR